MFGFQIASSAFPLPWGFLSNLAGEAADVPVCVVRKAVRGRLGTCFLSDGCSGVSAWFICMYWNWLLVIWELNLFLFHKTTTKGLLVFSEVLVTPRDTVRPLVQECRGERAKVLLGSIFWRYFSLGLDLLVILVHRNSSISKCIFLTYAMEW